MTLALYSQSFMCHSFMTYGVKDFEIVSNIVISIYLKNPYSKEKKPTNSKRNPRDLLLSTALLGFALFMDLLVLVCVLSISKQRCSSSINTIISVISRKINTSRANGQHHPGSNRWLGQQQTERDLHSIDRVRIVVDLCFR